MASKLSAGCVLTAYYWETAGVPKGQSTNTHKVNLLHVEKASEGKNYDNDKQEKPESENEFTEHDD